MQPLNRDQTVVLVQTRWGPSRHPFIKLRLRYKSLESLRYANCYEATVHPNLQFVKLLSHTKSLQLQFNPTKLLVRITGKHLT